MRTTSGCRNRNKLAVHSARAQSSVKQTPCQQDKRLSRCSKSRSASSLSSRRLIDFASFNLALTSKGSPTLLKNVDLYHSKTQISWCDQKSNRNTKANPISSTAVTDACQGIANHEHHCSTCTYSKHEQECKWQNSFPRVENSRLCARGATTCQHSVHMWTCMTR